MGSLCNRCHLRLERQYRSLVRPDKIYRRGYQPSKRQFDNPTPRFEPRGLGDFYNDLLAKPLPKVARAKSEADLPDFVASGGRKEIEERAKKLFGNIQGSGYQRQSDTPDKTWRTINGVPIPPRPGEPDNCCMSGCVQ